jgi:hypothetical protein
VVSHPLECRRRAVGQISSGIRPVGRMVARPRLAALRQRIDRFAAPAGVSPLVERKLKAGCERPKYSHPVNAATAALEG